MSLVTISKNPAGNAAVRLHPDDNVAVACVPLTAGQPLKVAGEEIPVLEPVPVGHKIAIRAITDGAYVLRYGNRIGRARLSIERGRHVHTHNVRFEDLTFDYEFPTTERPLPAAPADMPTFLGYPREDGRVGTRNYIAVVAASNCAAHAVSLIARSYECERLPPNAHGVVAFPHGEGCGHSIGPDIRQLERTLGGVLAHPNVSAAVILGLGCEVNQVAHYLGDFASGGSRLIGITLQQSGGTRAAVEAARREIARFLERAAAEERAEFPAPKIVLGLNCGGSDSFSGITANPALGVCSDLVTSYGGTAVLAETPEIVGAEHLLVRRARNREVAEKLLARIAAYKAYLDKFGGSFNDNPAPGNKEGGISNILEKSLGAVAKGGSSVLTDVLEYAERVTMPGLVFMDTPGYDPVSLTGLAAGGVNVIAFTTGRGSAIGSPVIPVIKIASNSATFHRMRDNMEINAGAIAEGEKTVAEVGREIFDLVLRVASGERTAAERLGHCEFVPWRIGPVV